MHMGMEIQALCVCNTVTAPVLPRSFLSFRLKVFTVAHALRMMSSYSSR